MGTFSCERLHRNTHRIHVVAGYCTPCPLGHYTCAHTSVYILPTARALRGKKLSLLKGSVQKSIWVSSGVRMHNHTIPHFLPRSYQTPNPGRWQEHNEHGTAGVLHVFPMVFLVTTGHVKHRSVSQSSAERRWTSSGPSEHHRLPGHHRLVPRRESANHNRPEVQHQEPERMCSNKPHLGIHSIVFQATEQTTHEYYVDFPWNDFWTWNWNNFDWFNFRTHSTRVENDVQRIGNGPYRAWCVNWNVSVTKS